MSVHSSFEHNQSFPIMGKREKSKMSSLLKGIMQFTGDELNSCSYTPDIHNNSLDCNKSFTGSLQEDTRPDSRQSLGKASKKFPIDNFEATGAFNKMVLTIDSSSTEILTANRQACHLFGYSSKDLIGMRMSELFKQLSSSGKRALMHDVCKAQGNVTITCGKVMDAVTASGKEVPVSFWMKKVEGSSEQPRCIVVLQPVVRVVAEFAFNSTGEILDCDDTFNLIHGSLVSLVGSNVHHCMPCYQIPEQGKRIGKDVRKQHTTSTTCGDLQTFPVSVYILSHEKHGDSDVRYVASVWYFTSIRGLISVDRTGKIESINNNFSLALLGYQTDELKNMNIEDLLPDVCVQLSENNKNDVTANIKDNLTTVFDVSNEQESKQSCGTFELVEGAAIDLLRTPTRCEEGDDEQDLGDSWVELSINSGSCLDKINALLNGSMAAKQNCSSDSAVHLSCDRPPPDDSTAQSSREPAPPSEVARANKRSSPLSGYQSDENGCCAKKFTSTPFGARTTSRVRTPLCEGHWEAQALHKNGTQIDVQYEMVIVDDRYYLWMSLKNNEQTSFSSSILYSSFNSTLPSLNASVNGALDFSLGAAIKQEAIRSNGSPPQEASEERLAIEGEFGGKYELVKSLGNGAFGFVQLARRKSDQKQFVVKFIRNDKVLDECWVDDFETNSRIPLEISLLCCLSHRNIVSVVEFFETPRFFSMVMTQHGEIDLFEFIDRSPTMNEYLASYIYRQIVSGIKYLHDRGVVHRDIKDENVIIDKKFHCKLIDFGSAAYCKPGKTFATFCGTIEYCAPEVLMGSRYEGPELDMWALGVTLYTLVYGENPFQTMEESIEATLKPPVQLSGDLMFLMRWLLQPVPEHRCKMQDLVDQTWLNLPVEPDEYTWSDAFPSTAADTSAVIVDENDENLADGSKLDVSIEMSAKATKKKREIDDLPPLTRRLENFNLNHSI